MDLDTVMDMATVTVTRKNKRGALHTSFLNTN